MPAKRPANKSMCSRKVSSPSDDEKATHKSHPGTVARRNVVKAQKLNHMFIFRKRKFTRLAIELLGNVEKIKDWKLSTKGSLALQAAVESYIVSLIRIGSEYATSSKRVTIGPMDIEFARNRTYPIEDRPLDLGDLSAPEELTDFAIKKLMAIAGSVRINSTPQKYTPGLGLQEETESATSNIRRFAVEYTNDILNKAVAFADFLKRGNPTKHVPKNRMLKEKHIIHALESINKNH